MFLIQFLIMSVLIASMDQGLIDFIKWVGTTYGGVALIMMWVGYRDYKREQRLGQRLDQIQDAHAARIAEMQKEHNAAQERNMNLMLVALRENTAAISQNAEANRQSNAASAETTRAVQALTLSIQKLEIVSGKH